MNLNQIGTMHIFPMISSSRCLAPRHCHAISMPHRQVVMPAIGRAMVLTAMFAASFARAETTAPQPQPTLTEAAPGAWNLAWNGVAARTYFIQTSTDLVAWQYQPVMAFGDGVWATTLGSTSPKYFVRLFYVDDTIATTLQQARDADFDNDGIPNYYELENLFTNPMDKNSAGGDSDADGLPDGWELFHFGGLGIADPNAALQPDGLSNKDKAELGLNPNTDYSAQSATQPTSYSYDLVGRLTGVTAPVAAATFTPDAEGNLLNAQ